MANGARIPPRLLKAMVQQESHFDPNARSPKGAMGLVQLMPATWRELGGGNPADPATNLRHAATYVGQLLRRYRGDVSKALAAYNWGMGHVDRGGPMPRETRVYVQHVMDAFRGRAYR